MLQESAVYLPVLGHRRRLTHSHQGQVYLHLTSAGAWQASLQASSHYHLPIVTTQSFIYKPYIQNNKISNQTLAIYSTLNTATAVQYIHGTQNQYQS